MGEKKYKKEKVKSTRREQASGIPPLKKGKPPKPGAVFGGVAVRTPAETPTTKRGKICPKTGRAGCKCHRSSGTGGGCKN
jgi:hypothetical protein